MGWEEVDGMINEAMAEGVFPGAAVGAGRLDGFKWSRAYGRPTYDGGVACTTRSIWDVASLTKVLATVPCVMKLFEEGMVDLDSPVATYLHGFGRNGKEEITLRQLLSHTAGLRAWFPFQKMGFKTKEEVLEFVLQDTPVHPVGKEPIYSDLDMIVVGYLVESVSGKTLAEFSEENVFQPLGMSSTGFRKVDGEGGDPDIIPTEVDCTFRKRLLWGEVHDPTAYLMGGCAGNAGLFTSLLDIMKFAEVMLGEGYVKSTGKRLFRADTIRTFTEPQTGRGTPYPFALGWDTKLRFEQEQRCPAGSRMSANAYGHTGFTGTSLWIDPVHKTYVCMLTNVVHPTADSPVGGRICDLRPEVADISMGLLMGWEAPWKKGEIPLRQSANGEQQGEENKVASHDSWPSVGGLPANRAPGVLEASAEDLPSSWDMEESDSAIRERRWHLKGADTIMRFGKSMGDQLVRVDGPHFAQQPLEKETLSSQRRDAKATRLGQGSTNLSTIRDVSLLALVTVWSMLS